MNILTTWGDHHPNRTRTSTRPPPLFTTAPCPYTPHTPSQFYTTLHTIPIAIEHINDIPPIPHRNFTPRCAPISRAWISDLVYTPYPIAILHPVPYRCGYSRGSIRI